METAKNYLSKLKEIFLKENEGSAVDRMTAIIGFINTFANVSGLQFEGIWKRNARTFIAYFVVGMVTTFGIYSVCVAYSIVTNLIMVGGFAFFATVWTKIFFVSRNHQKFMSVVRFVFNVFERNASGPRERILLNVTKTIRYHFKVNSVCIIGGLIVYSAYPVYDCIFNGNFTPVSPAVMPFVDPTHLRGYIITTLYNIFVIAAYLLTINIATSLLFFTFVDVYDGLVSLFENDFGIFDDMWLKKQSRKTYDAKFRNLMMQLMDLASIYMDHLYNVIATVQIVSAYLVVVSSVAAYLIFDYMSGTGSGITLYAEILMYCYIGQLLDDANERIITVICNAKWYNYDVKYQKQMITALSIAQNIQPICLANIYPLNFATGVQITKSIYTLIMFMMEMVD